MEKITKYDLLIWFIIAILSISLGFFMASVGVLELYNQNLEQILFNLDYICETTLK